MTLQRTLSSLGEAAEPTRYSLILPLAGSGQRIKSQRLEQSLEEVICGRRTACQVSSAGHVQDEILVFAALAHSGVDEVPLGVGVVGLVVAAAESVVWGDFGIDARLVHTRPAPAFHLLSCLARDPVGTWGRER